MLQSFPPEQDFSYLFLNFDSADAWPHLILRYRPPSFYSTSFWETKHEFYWQLKTAGNMKDIEKNMLKQQAWTLLVTYNFTQKIQKLTLSATSRKLLQTAYASLALQEPNINTNKEQHYAIFLDGHLHYPPFFVQVTSKSESYICLVKQLFTHTTSQHVPWRWLKVKIFKSKPPSSTSQVYTLKPSSTQYLPLSKHSLFNISTKIHVIDTGKSFIVNPWTFK